jgi:hypothetical protein
MFSTRWWGFDVPGIGGMTVERFNTQASASLADRQRTGAGGRNFCGQIDPCTDCLSALALAAAFSAPAPIFEFALRTRGGCLAFVKP